MIGSGGVHRPDHTQVVRGLRQVWKEFTDFDPALAVLAELEGGRHEVAAGSRLALLLLQGWLVVEGVDVRWAAS